MEPFGVWFCWLICENNLLAILDLQNSAIACTLSDAINNLAWAEEPCSALFYAPYTGERLVSLTEIIPQSNLKLCEEVRKI
jgi:hypothetical protein